MWRVLGAWVAAAWLALGIGPAAAAPARAAGLTPAQAGAVDRYVRAEMARQRIPGLQLGVYRDGKSVLERGYGTANLEWRAPVTADTLFQSGSVGKQFVATAVMMLVEEGKVGLTDSITKYFPDAPESWKPIKVENLLSHTSGLSEYESGERSRPGGEFDLRLDFTESELVAKIEKLPIEWAPGDKWDYRNTNYVLLGVLIHKVTGKFYGDFLHERIFAPLGMSATRIISDADVIPGRSAGYEMRGGKLRNQTFVSPTFNSTADGTLYFNVVDLQRWDSALRGEQLLKAASLQRMWTPFKLNDGKPNSAGYGFGWFIGDMNGRRLINHSGSWQGFTTQISRYVDDGLTVVVLTNLDAGHSSPGLVAQTVAGLIAPGLMPKAATPLADDHPEIARTVRTVLDKARAGGDLSAELTPATKAGLAPDTVADILSALPAGWTEAPMVLVQRETNAQGTLSRFRVGKAGDYRRVVVSTDATGRVQRLRVGADPDNR